jgi:TATA-box binding protein (TBP) (component of TFIID and TFIIIB)
MYRISTITAIGSINTLIDLNLLYNIIDLDDLKLPYKDSLIFIEYGKNKNISNSKGVNPKQKKNKKVKKRFDNQLTIILNVENNVNLKIFKNGRIQMTGLKKIDNGIIAINIIIDIIKYYYNLKKEIIDDINNLKLSDYKICLINSDFKFKYKIKRTDLFKFLINNTKLICSYEPCIYPGVKIQYFYNDSIDGICNCDKYCENKNKNSTCVKITIAIFESGCTIITGSKNIKQIENTYNYIYNLIDTNIKLFEKKELELPI